MNMSMDIMSFTSDEKLESFQYKGNLIVNTNNQNIDIGTLDVNGTVTIIGNVKINILRCKNLKLIKSIVSIMYLEVNKIYIFISRLIIKGFIKCKGFKIQKNIHL